MSSSDLPASVGSDWRIERRPCSVLTRRAHLVLAASMLAGALALSCVAPTASAPIVPPAEPVPVSPYAPEDPEDEEELAQSAPLRKDAAERGRALFENACATCHGLRGDGNGPSAGPLDPKPRDFTQGIYKWRSTESGSLPLDGDIFRTISRGVPGTGMVAWGELLSTSDRWDLVEYLRTLTDRFEEEGVEEDEIIAVPEPVLATAETVARGKEVYTASKCWECHGESGRGDGPSASTLEDSWGRPIRPFDFTTGQYRCGSGDRAVYRTFFTGLNGTPMPGYSYTISEEDRWPLVHYVRSLQREPGFLERIIFEEP